VAVYRSVQHTIAGDCGCLWLHARHLLGHNEFDKASLARHPRPGEYRRDRHEMAAASGNSIASGDAMR